MEKWYQIYIEIDLSESEIISNFLFEYEVEGVFIEKENSEKTIIRGFFNSDSIDKNDLENTIKSEFKNLKLEIKEVEKTDWVDNSQKEFKVFKVGENLVFKPIWQNYEPMNNQEIIIDFDPGSFFGVTPHPSTRLCIEEIEILSKDLNKNIRILDLGVGSGILSLAFYKLGFKYITAIDIDVTAISTSEDNFKLNNMDINLFFGEIKDCNGKFDFIAGNLLSETIIELASQISEKLNNKGIFIGAGINKNQEKEITKVLNQYNLKVDYVKYSNEWILIKAQKIIK